MATFDRQPFASTHPAIDALFAREFANRQAQREEDAKAAADATGRAQIAAQSQLAQAQLQEAQQQADYNRLFREREFQAKEAGDKIREAQANRGLDIQEKYFGVRPGLADETRKNDIATANAQAKAAAARVQDAYESSLETALNAEAGARTHWYMPGDKAAHRKVLDDPMNPDRQKIEQDTWNLITSGLKNDKTGAGSLIIPDFKTRTFKPVQYDSAGNLNTGPYTTGKPNEYDYLGNPVANPAALGAKVTVMPPSVITGSAPTTTASGDSNLADIFRVMAIGAMPSVFGATKTPAAAPIVPAPSVRRTFSNASVLLTPEDDAMLTRQPLETVPALVEGWLRSGRATLAPSATPPIPYTEPSYNRF